MDLPNDELLALIDDPAKGGLAMWRLAQRTGEYAPDWGAFLAKEDDANRRFRGAVAAAEAGIDSPAVIAVLQQCADSLEKGEPLGVKSSARCIVAVLALADLNVPGTAERIGRVLLSDVPGPTDCLLLLKGLQTAGEPAGIQVVKDFLAATEGEAFLASLWGVSDGCPSSFRYAIDIRAVRTLLALGCTDEVGRLEAYVNDPVLLIRRHARHVQMEAEPLLAK
jgi:hypothetical protein